MNIFQNFDVYLGALSTGDLSAIPAGLALQIHKIRKTLGRKSYLLDNYLKLLFTGFTAVLGWQIAEDGFQLYGGLRKLCLAAIDGAAMDDPFYGRVASYIQEHPLDFDCQYTKAGLYTLQLAEEYLHLTTPQTLARYRQEIGRNIDIILIGSLYTQMTKLCGESPLEVLNEAIRKQYAAVNATDLLLQGFYSHMCYSLAERDDETGREMFLLMLDNSLASQPADR
jgi:hypothetical protein